jgi:hypothetical protein
MQLIIFILVPLTLTIIATYRPRADYACAIILAILLTLFAGFRLGGFDYDEYVVTIDTVRSVEDGEWLTQLTFAKDPMFLLVIKACSYFSDDYTPIFLLMAAIGMAAKLLTCRVLPRFKTLFLSLYCIFLSPGFELAAIRAAVGIGLLSLSLVYLNKIFPRYLLSVLAISAHLSTAIGVFFAAISDYLKRTNSMVLAVMIAVFAYKGADFLLTSSRGDVFTDNIGTALSLLWPIYSFIVIYLFVRPFNFAVGIRDSLAFRSSFYIAFCCIAFSIGISLPAVTISFRILEIGQYFLLLCIILMMGLARGRVPRISALFALGALVVMLSSLNIYRETWKVINDFSFDLF